MSEPHCERDENLMSSDLLYRTSGDSNFVMQVGDSSSSGHAAFYFLGEEPTRVLQRAIFEILLHIGGGLAAQLILTVVQKFTNVCSRRARTSGGTVDDRVRRRRRGRGILH